MFAKLKKLMGWSTQRNNRTSPVALRLSDVDITYKPQLVAELRQDHCDLLRLFGRLAEQHTAGNFDACVALLQEFTGALRGHLLKENLHLYVYLKHALKEDTESSALMSSMRHDMQKIGKVLNAFVTNYTNSPWDATTRSRLATDLATIAGVLQQRIALEEKVLYPLYLPPAHYA